MNFSVVPDFVAIGGLIAVFQSLLKRTRQTRLGFWLVGWVLLLIHIAAQFVNQNLDAESPAAISVSLAMLLFASVAFIWAASDLRDAGLRTLSATLACAFPDVALLVCAVYGVTANWPYALLTLAGLGTSLWMFRGGRRAGDRARGIRRVLLTVGVYVVQGALLASDHLTLTIIWMLCWHYLAVAVFYRLSAPRASAGVVFTTVSFVAWALVFPVGYAMAVWLPHVHVEAEVWNLPKFLVATGMIFTLLEEQLSKAEHASRHDALTGLPNRRLFSYRLQRSIDAAKEGGTCLALLVIDLDDFKQINDTRGHAVGDVLLQRVADRFRSHLRQDDTLARLGGDEFAVILGDVHDRRVAEDIGRKLRRSLDDGTVIDGEYLRVHASVGVSMYPGDAHDPTQLYAVADRAMYDRKGARAGAASGPGLAAVGGGD